MTEINYDEIETIILWDINGLDQQLVFTAEELFKAGIESTEINYLSELFRCNVTVQIETKTTKIYKG